MADIYAVKLLFGNTWIIPKYINTLTFIKKKNNVNKYIDNTQMTMSNQIRRNFNALLSTKLSD